MQTSKKYHFTYAACLRIIFALSFLLVGLYYELCSAVVTAALLVLLIGKSSRDGFKIKINEVSIAVAALTLFYLLTSFYGIDKGLSFWGFVKILPVPLFLLCLMQGEEQDRTTILKDIPLIGAGTAVLSFGLQFIPSLNSTFSVNNRLAGFFQYPNTFACFLLLGIIILILEAGNESEKSFAYSWPVNAICGAVLVFALLQAGSRTIFVLSIPLFIACLIIKRNKKILFVSLGAIAAAALVTFLVSLADVGSAERVLNISTGSSTLLGRLLYWKDALPVILRHPFGLGYLGYYITETGFQSGVYAVRWVHNDLLQLMLDVGWVPAILCAFAAVKSIFSKNISHTRRMVLIALLLHCMIDFDLQFISMYLVLLLCPDLSKAKEHKFSLKKIPAIFSGVLIGLISLYIGIVSAFTYGDKAETAAGMYPWNTLADVQLLGTVTTAEDMEALADKILAQNEYVSLAWSAKAMVDYSQGNFADYIETKKRAIELNKYDIDEYVDYFQTLAFAVNWYRGNGDDKGAAACLSEIVNIQSMLEELEKTTDPLALRIQDKPVFTMPDEYYEYLEAEGF